MTRKDFELIAATLKGERNRLHENARLFDCDLDVAVSTIDILAHDFADRLKETNRAIQPRQVPTRVRRNPMIEAIQSATYEALEPLGPLTSALTAGYAVVLLGVVYITPAGERYLSSRAAPSATQSNGHMGDTTL